MAWEGQRTNIESYQCYSAVKCLFGMWKALGLVHGNARKKEKVKIINLSLSLRNVQSLSVFWEITVGYWLGCSRLAQHEQSWAVGS